MENEPQRDDAAEYQILRNISVQVIISAMQDVLKSPRRVEQGQALSFLTGSSPDWAHSRDVYCDCAGINSECIADLMRGFPENRELLEKRMKLVKQMGMKYNVKTSAKSRKAYMQTRRRKMRERIEAGA